MTKVVVNIEDVIGQFEKYDAKIRKLREALECVVLYWDKWKDAPDDHPTALSLEEVVNVARSTLKEGK